MKITFTGNSGFLASSIREMNMLDKAEYIGLKRDEPDEKWREKIAQSDVVINLAGAPIVQRWTEKNKSIIMNSRLTTTQRVVQIPGD
jgi:NAD dependent epimerase/dehydratase family enzyme